MRKTIAAATAALIMLAGGQVPAWAAGPEAPTDVQVSWVDAAAGTFKVTWKDGGEANWLRLEYEDQDPPALLASVKADAPNEFVRSGSKLSRDKVARIVVVTRDDAGVESAAASSPWFDTNHPAVANLLTATAQADGSIRLGWYREQAPQDTTPNDPLDRPSTDEHVVSTTSGQAQSFSAPTGATTMTIPPLPRPYGVKLTTQNEWGSSVSLFASTVSVTTLTTSFTLPAVGQYLSTMPFTAAVGSPECSAVRCDYGPVYLQARADAAKPWATIGKYEGGGPKFAASIGVYGGRQYRVYVPAWSYNRGSISVAPPSSTPAQYSAALAKFAVVGFDTASARVGQLVKATISVLPAGTVKANLEWYDGKAWHHGAYIPLTKGKGTLSFKASGRGTTRYWRVTVPKMTMNGLPILATPSRSFKLGVR